MSDQEQPGDLSEEEQTVIAMDWFMAMWDEAMKRGVTAETMALTALSVTASKLAATFGASQAASLLKNTAKTARSGGFNTDENSK